MRTRINYFPRHTFYAVSVECDYREQEVRSDLAPSDLYGDVERWVTEYVESGIAEGEWLFRVALAHANYLRELATVRDTEGQVQWRYLEDGGDA